MISKFIYNFCIFKKYILSDIYIKLYWFYDFIIYL